MLTLIIRRLAILIPLLLVVSVGVFGLQELIPGDPAVALAGGDNATPATIAHVRKELGLNDPFIVQYGRWLGHAVHGDLGTSLQYQQPVSSLIAQRLPITLSLTFLALVFAVLLSLIAGVASGLRPGGVIDRVALVGSSLGIAIPSFWLAMILIGTLAVSNRLFPALGYTNFGTNPFEWFRHLVLPAISLGAFAAASQTRQLRGALLDVLDTNYIRTAWAKGGSPRSVVGKHALKNSAIPVITVIGLQVSALLGFTVIIERIFVIPGMGSALVDAIQSKDLPAIQGFVIVFVVINILVNLLVDMTYGYLNPKIQVA
jgi:peptide/nickel transport system permease protein